MISEIMGFEELEFWKIKCVGEGNFSLGNFEDVEV